MRSPKGKGCTLCNPAVRKVAIMAIYSCNISNVSRAKGSSSVATLSYIEAEKYRDERTGILYDYGRAERVIGSGTIIPYTAPEDFLYPEKLFNSIELYEKADNARTAKKIIVALPREFDKETSMKVLDSYITNNLVEKGYCATFAIHTDKENNNPHAHILVANRQIDDKGEWASKRKMEYVLDDKGERTPLLDENGEQKKDKNGRKQWKRRSAEVNPLDTKEMLQQLRENWAKECNKFLDQGNQIDHRSFKDRGIDDIPTIHEGYAAREREKRGEKSERCEYNREIMSFRWLREKVKAMKEELKHMMERLESIPEPAPDPVPAKTKDEDDLEKYIVLPDEKPVGPPPEIQPKGVGPDRGLDLPRRGPEKDM